jgi:hypothetical protein
LLHHEGATRSGSAKSMDGLTNEGERGVRLRSKALMASPCWGVLLPPVRLRW